MFVAEFFWILCFAGDYGSDAINAPSRKQRMDLSNNNGYRGYPKGRRYGPMANVGCDFGRHVAFARKRMSARQTRAAKI